MKLPLLPRIVLPLLLTLACSNTSGPDDLLRESGTFVLQKPSPDRSGYDFLAGENTSISTDTDLQLDACFFSGNRLDSLYLACGLTSRGGGLTRRDGLLAPAGAYQLAYVVNRFDLAALPLQYFVRCRGDSNYAKVMFDSVRTGGDTCRAYFNYVLNVDPYEREFVK